MLESKIQAKIIKYLKDKAYVIKTISTNKSGVPDLICCYPFIINNKTVGIFIGIEVKTGYNNLSELQKYHLEEIKNNGGFSVCVWSLEELKIYLERIGDILMREKEE